MKIKITQVKFSLVLLVLSIFSIGTMAQTSVTSGTTNKGYALNAAATAVDPALTITSASNITGFKVTISSGLKSADVLAYTGTLPAGITVTAYNSGTGVIAFVGTTTAAAWQTFLRTVTYRNTNTSQFGDRTITFSAGTLSANSNGHFYELVSSNSSWTAHKANAAARSYLGLAGYLATITSAAENAFVRQVLNADAWMGCSDDFTQINAATGVTTFANQAAAEGKWYWVTGPEKGTMFSVGNGSPVTQSGQYANWNSGEPNNSGSEHYGQIYSSGGTPGAWNDLPNGVNIPYVVEYGGLAGDPVLNLTSNTTIYTEISSNTTSSGQTICGSTSASTITGATPYGGYGTYTYKWISSTTNATSGFANASGTINATNYSPGTLGTTTWYRRVVTSGSLSDTTAEVLVSVNPAVTSTGTSSNVSCNGTPNATASISVSGGTPSYTYSWTPSGGSGATASNLAAGSYTCLVTDGAGCTTSQNYTITQPIALTASTSSSNVACNGAATGLATVSPTGGTGAYTYVWSPSGGTMASASNLTAGSYSCLVTDANGCAVTRNITITQASALSVATSSTNVACNGAFTGAASNTPSGGTSPYTYAWSNGGNSSFKNTLGAGTYTCTITDANACTSVKVFTITQPAALSATASTSNINCFGNANGSASITVSGGVTGYSYSWSPSGGVGSTASNLTAGSYTCIVTDANGCTLNRNYTISQPSVLSANQLVTAVTCNGGSNGFAGLASSGGTGSLTYVWTPNVSTTNSVSGLTAGNYSCTITDANGCSTTNSMTVTQPSAFSVSTTSTAIPCFGQAVASASVSVSGSTSPYTYSWSNGGTSSTKNGLTAGTYICTITDANSCTTTEVFVITQPSALISSTTSTNVSCNGGSNANASVTVSGGTSTYNYSWTPSGGTTATASGLSAGSYTCNITDANGCTSSQAIVISEPTVLSTTSSGTNAPCNSAATGSASVQASGGTSGYTYVWSPTGGNNAIASGLIAGNYSCLISDANGCTSSESVTITEPSAISVIQGSTNATCNSFTDASASVSVSGGNAPYTYLWTDGSTLDNTSNLGVGIHECTITDANGCIEISSFNIIAPNAITATFSVIEPICFGGEGEATIAAVGGTGSLTYAWSSGGNSTNENNLYAGTYTVIVTDVNGCTSAEQVTLTEPAQIQSTVSYTTPLCNGGTGDATITTTGGTGTINYMWMNGNTTSSQSGLTAGNFAVSITDANGCLSLITVTMTQPSAIVLSATTQNALCNGGVGTATISANGGTGTYSYDWSTGGTTDTEINLAAGTYPMTVTDQNGCDATTLVTITEPSAIGVTSTTSNEMTGNDGSIDLNVSGGTPGYTFLWDNGATTEDISGLAAGDYTVIVTDGNGCTFSTIITVSSSVGLFDINNNAQIIFLYPNPNQGLFTIKGQRNVNYRLVDAIGKTISTFQLNSNDGTLMDFSNLSNGIYFIQSDEPSKAMVRFSIMK